MRPVTELHDRLLDDLRLSIWRPSMRGGSAQGIEVLLQHLLSTLCFIDRREGEWEVAASTFLQGCLQVRGQLQFQHRPFPDYVNEVASVYAEVAFSLRYFKPDRLLTEREMVRIKSVANGDEFRARDHSEAEIHAQFGSPSHEVVGGLTKVACYGCEREGVRWMFFDLAGRLPDADDWLPEPLVRDFRDGPHNQMHLLPIGEYWAGDK